MLMALLLALVVVAASVTIFLLLAPRTPVPGAEDGRKTAIFGIGRITVEGDTRYASADIIEKSGAFLGQSVFTLDKKGMAERVLEAFPYIEKVAVDSPSFDHVRITVSEVALLGAVSAGESWWMIGTNNKLLERLPSGEAVP
ncbi:MAG: FtsQ-type POTRA domain-containing protein, partial [Clostridiales bacterium]|nr:FtsQ-type POTRA domain-containing protein [Clostridiales bacterium]